MSLTSLISTQEGQLSWTEKCAAGTCPETVDLCNYAIFNGQLPTEWALYMLPESLSISNCVMVLQYEEYIRSEVGMTSVYSEPLFPLCFTFPVHFTSLSLSISLWSHAIE